MKRTSLALALLGSVSFGAAAYGIQAALDSPPTLMSRVDHDRQWREIERTTRIALGHCRQRPQQARETCRIRARAEDRVAKADLDARYFGTVQAEAEARDVRARASFEAARADCLVREEPERTSCLAAARTEQAKVLASARPATT